jgi:hypothetical protein
VNFCRKYRGEGESIPLVLSCCFSAKEEEMGCLLQWTKQKNRRKESCRKQRPKLQKNKGDRESFESLEKEKCGLKGGLFSSIYKSLDGWDCLRGILIKG